MLSPRYGLDVFRRFFEAILEQCQQAKLIWGKELYIDATKVDANASVDSLTTRFAVEAREAFQKHVAQCFFKKKSINTYQSLTSPLSKLLPNLHLCQRPCPKKSEKCFWHNRLPAMIGLQKEESNNARCAVFINVGLISGLAPLIQMQLL